MNGFTAFFKKELRELYRSGKLILFVALFILIGILNAATAQLTPWLLKYAADSGITITVNEVTAMDAWVQFFKNIPICMIAVLVVFSNIFANEYVKGTLLPLISKGLTKSAVTMAKFLTALLIWTVGYWLCYGVTYAYASFYWDNSIMKHPAAAAAFYWLFGILLVCAMTLFAACADSSMIVLLGTGGLYIFSFLLDLIPRYAKYLPKQLTNAQPLLTGASKPSDYFVPSLISIVLSVVFLSGALYFGRRKVSNN